MKPNYRKILLAALTLQVVLSGSSCKKYLDVESPSTISQDVAFSSTSYTNSAIIGVYNQLCGDNGTTKEGTIWAMMADDFKTSGSYSAQDRRGIAMYGASAENAELEKGFNQLYTGIERANICIAGIKSSALYADGAASKALMGKYLGEALTLRAYFYFVLVRNWGSVVAKYEPSAQTPILDVPVTPGKEILDHVLSDLKEAAELVEWRAESGYTSTRWTKGAIKGLTARVALFRGGYLMNKDSHLMERDTEYKKYYQVAYDACKEVMDRRDQHNLNPVYENVFKSLHGSTRFDPTFELMFDVGAYGAGARTDTKLGYYNGLRLNSASKYGGSSGGVNAIATYFYEFDQLGDCRRDVTIGSYEIDATGQKVLNTLNNMTDAKFRRSWTSVIGDTQNLGVNWPVLRFADILLMFAEADNEINNGPTELGKSALLEVRRRAFVGFEERMPAMPENHADFFNAIVKERLLEFGAEAIRKYDLIRWNIMGSKFQETREKLLQLKDGLGPYANIPTHVHVKAAAYRLVTAQEEFNTLDTYGGSPRATLFQPGIGSGPKPDGYTTKNWRASLNEEYITGERTGFATYFESNKKEVFPFHQNTLLYNTNIKQNFGY